MRNRENPYADNKFLIDTLSEMRFKSVDTDANRVYENVWNKINHHAELYPVIGVRPIWKYFSVASVILLFILSGMFFQVRHEETVMMEIAAVAGSKTKVVLPDGSIAWLNSNAVLRYPHKFSQKLRKVELVGEGYFEVLPNTKQPFHVQLDGMRIEVLGTMFNVISEEESDFIETILKEGSVALYGHENKTTVPDVILKPDQHAIYNKKTGEIEVDGISSGLYTTWVKGIFVFDDNTLEEIFTVLARAFQVKVYISDPELAQKRLSAKFLHQESLDEILSILQINAQYTYKKEKKEVFID